MTQEDKSFDTLIKPLLNDHSFAEIDANVIVECARVEADRISKDVIKNNQLRKFYDVIKQIERQAMGRSGETPLSDKSLAQLLFLRPHLHNAVEKAGKRSDKEKQALKQLEKILSPCLQKNVLQKKEDLRWFVKFFEAIIAYI